MKKRRPHPIVIQQDPRQGSLDAMIKIMLIEDNAAYRKTMEWALEQTDGMELSHQFGTAAVG